MKYFVTIAERDEEPILLTSDKETKEEVIQDFIGELITMNYEFEDDEIPENWDMEWIHNLYDWYDVLVSFIYNAETGQQL